MLDALTPEELQFIKAIEKYKKEHEKHFLSWTEVLKVVKAAGYRKVADPEDIPVKPRSRAIQPLPRADETRPAESPRR